MNRYFLNDDQSIRQCISANENVLALNTSAGAEYVDAEEKIDLTDYWDVDLRKFVGTGQSPSSYHTFDYALKQWVDPRSLVEIKEQKWGEIKLQRDRLEFSGFEFNGQIYDSDMKSQGRISAAASLSASVEWTLQDNSTVWLESDDLKRLVAALAMHVTQVHARGKAAREAIEAATTVEEVEAVIL